MRVHPRTGELDIVDLSDKNFKKNETTKSCDSTVIGQSQEYSGVYYSKTRYAIFGDQAFYSQVRSFRLSKQS